MNYDVLKSNSPCILLNKNINFNKNKTELKMENPTPRKRTFFVPKATFITFVFYLNV